MENAVDALKMAFAVLIFVIAIGLAFAVFSQAKEVADIVLYTNDKTNFEEYIPEIAVSNRIVGLETIVPAINNYIHENDGYCVEVIDGSKTYIFDITVQNEDGIITDSDFRKYRDEKLKEILTKYKGEEVSFTESFSEEEYSGGTVELSNGETIEKVNTRTKVKITYTRN